MSVLFVFIDGVGLGRPGASNPFDGAPIEILAPLAGPHARGRSDVVYAALDATLGHAGLPQSATGQATLYTGSDAIAAAGGHRSGWPIGALVSHITRESMFAKARARGIRAAFLNAHDTPRAERYVRVLRGEEARPKRFPMSASTIAAIAGSSDKIGTSSMLATERALAEGRAATFDLTGDAIRARGFDTPTRSIDDAARAIATGARAHDLALFETFLTDAAGHSQDMTWARHELLRVERFLATLTGALDASRDLVVVTSDHGNLEDLSTRSHTRNKVPLLAWGRGAASFAAEVDARGGTLANVAPALLDAATLAVSRPPS